MTKADEDFDVDKARADYGQAEIKTLTDKFGYDQDVNSLTQEWDDWMTKSCRKVVRALTRFESKFNTMKCLYP